MIELRDHGVSGTPAEDMLDCPTEFLKQEAGDKYAGFYRCRPCDCDGDDQDSDGPPVKEAYSWGGLTSGSASRALWLLFLPFILINLAHWMLPPSETGRRSARTAVTSLRLLALSLTLTLMLASVQVAVDIVGWQCTAMARCAGRLGPLSGLIRLRWRAGGRHCVACGPDACPVVDARSRKPGERRDSGKQPHSTADTQQTRGQESAPPTGMAHGSTKEPPPDSAVETKDNPLTETNSGTPMIR